MSKRPLTKSPICDVLRPLASQVEPTRTAFDKAMETDVWGRNDYCEYIILRRSTLESHHGKHLVFTGSVTKGSGELVFDQKTEASPAGNSDRLPMIYVATGVQREADKVSAHLAWKLLKIGPPSFVMEGPLEKGWVLMLAHFQELRQKASDTGLEERRKSHNRTLTESGNPPMSLAAFVPFQTAQSQIALVQLERLSPEKQKLIREEIQLLPQVRNPIKNAADSLWDQVDQLLQMIDPMQPTEMLRMALWKAYHVGREVAQLEILSDQDFAGRVEQGLKFNERARARSDHGRLIEKCWNEMLQEKGVMPKPRQVLEKLIELGEAQMIGDRQTKDRLIGFPNVPDYSAGEADRQLTRKAFNRICDLVRGRHVGQRKKFDLFLPRVAAW